MKNIVTNAAGISILRLIDNTLKTGGGPISIGATVVQAPKGRVGSVMSVTYANWEDLLGVPYPKTISDRTQMEGLRHLADAVKECAYVNVVRVLHSDALFPSISFRQIDDKGAWAESTPYLVNDVVTITDGSKLICVNSHTSTSSAPTSANVDWDAYTTPAENDTHSFGTEISIGSGYLGSLYPIDGEPSANRSITITNIDPVNKRFTLKFYDKDSAGVEYLLEYWQVGVDVNDKDDMGRSVFIETLLEERSSRFRCDWNTDADWAEALDAITAVSTLSTKPAFTGGTNGGTPTTQEWITAWDMFRNEQTLAYLMFAAGNYDEDVLANCIDIAEIRHIMFFLDIPCYMNQSTASTWLASASLESRLASSYYCPIAAKDAWYGGKTIWGASGAAVAACAKGDANFTGDTPGVHYSPAGSNRAILSRTGVELLFPDDVLDRDALVASRINPIIISGSGSAMIDDALTLWPKQNYSRFIWVNRIANYIDHQFLEMAAYMQHEPDGLTYKGLYRGMQSILDKLVTSGALVTPRTTTGGDSPYSVNVQQAETDSNPYVFTVEQPEIDRWLVTWSFCPVGSARRIVGQPILIL